MTDPADGPARRPDRDGAASGATAGPAKQRNALQAASDAVVSPALARSNPFAAGAIAVGVIGLLFGAYGVLPVTGLVVSVLGLVRSRRLAREGVPRTGAVQSIVGLVLSVVGLLLVLPPAAQLLPGGLLGG